jgi:flagellar hook-length control protein FliK
VPEGDFNMRVDLIQTVVAPASGNEIVGQDKKEYGDEKFRNVMERVSSEPDKSSSVRETVGARNGINPGKHQENRVNEKVFGPKRQAEKREHSNADKSKNIETGARSERKEIRGNRKNRENKDAAAESLSGNQPVGAEGSISAAEKAGSASNLQCDPQVQEAPPEPVIPENVIQALDGVPLAEVAACDPGLSFVNPAEMDSSANPETGGQQTVPAAAMADPMAAILISDSEPGSQAKASGENELTAGFSGMAAVSVPDPKDFMPAAKSTDAKSIASSPKKDAVSCIEDSGIGLEVSSSISKETEVSAAFPPEAADANRRNSLEVTELFPKSEIAKAEAAVVPDMRESAPVTPDLGLAKIPVESTVLLNSQDAVAVLETQASLNRIAALAQDFSEVPPAAAFNQLREVQNAAPEWVIFARRASAVKNMVPDIPTAGRKTETAVLSEAEGYSSVQSSEDAPLEILSAAVDSIAEKSSAKNTPGNSPRIGLASDVRAPISNLVAVVSAPLEPAKTSGSASPSAALSSETHSILNSDTKIVPEMAGQEDSSAKGADSSPDVIPDRKLAADNRREIPTQRTPEQGNASGGELDAALTFPRAVSPVPIAHSNSMEEGSRILRPAQNSSTTAGTTVAGSTALMPDSSASDLKALAALVGTKPGSPASDPSFLTQMADRMQAHIQKGQDMLRIQLKPESLGWLEIRAESSRAGVVATIATESAEVKSYLENNLHQLQQTFQDQGLKIDRIQVTVQQDHGQQQPSSGFQESRSGSRGQEAPSPSPWRNDDLSAASDEYAGEIAALTPLAPNTTFHTVA